MVTRRRVVTNASPCTCENIQERNGSLAATNIGLVHCNRASPTWRREMQYFTEHPNNGNNYVGNRAHHSSPSRAPSRSMQMLRSDPRSKEDIKHGVSDHNVVVDYRDTVFNVRNKLALLEEELEMERAKLACSQKAVHEREADVLRLKEHNDRLKRRMVDTDRELKDANEEINILSQKYHDMKLSHGLLKEKNRVALGLLEKHCSDSITLSMKLEASMEKERGDSLKTKEYYDALRLAKRDIEDIHERLEHRDGARKNDREVAGVLAEALKFQRFNTQRLLGIFLYTGTLAKSALNILDTNVIPVGKLYEKIDEIATLCSSVQFLGGGSFQYMSPSLTHTGKTNFTNETALQELQEVVKYYAAGGRVEEFDGTEYLTGHGVLLGNAFRNSQPVFRSLYTESDHWIPAECVALTQLFREQHFPNSKPEIFYAFMLRIATILKDLCGLSSLNKLLKITEHKKAIAWNYHGANSHHQQTNES